MGNDKWKLSWLRNSLFTDQADRIHPCAEEKPDTVDMPARTEMLATARMYTQSVFFYSCGAYYLRHPLLPTALQNG